MVKVLFLILFLFPGALCFSQTVSNGTGGGDWNVGASWVGGVVPPTGADVVIATGDVITISGAVTNDDINSLTLQGTGQLNYTGIETIVVSTSITMSGTSSITGSAGGHRIDAATFNVTSGSAEIGGIQLNVSGNTTTSAGTTLLFSSLTGVKTLQNLTVSGDLNFSANETLGILGNFQMSGTSAIGGAGNGLLNVTGTFTVPSGTATIGGSRLAITGLTTISGNLVFNNSTGTKAFTNFTVNSTGNVNFTANETASIAGNLEMLGNSSITGSSNAHIIDVTGNFNVTSGTATIGGIRLVIAGVTTISGNLVFDNSIGTKDFVDVNINSAGNVNFTANETMTVAGNLTMSGTSSITGSSNGFIVPVTGNFSVPSGSATIAGIQLTINGTATVGGTLTFTDPVGVKTFSGEVTVTGTWNNTSTSNFTFGGNITNNGTWNGCSDGVSCIYTLTNAAGVISGSGNTNVSDLQIDAPASITNNGNVVMTDNIRGTGAFINGATGVLTLSENGLYDITTLNLTTSGNTVIYAGTTNEVIDIGPFHHLIINMASALPIVQVNGTDVTVNGNFTVNQGDFRVNANVLNIIGDYDINGGSSDLNTATVNFTNMDMTGGTINVANTIITSTGLISIIGGTFTVDGAAGTHNYNSLTVGAAGTWNVTAAYSPTFTGNLVNNGSFTGCNGLGCVYTLTNNPGSISGSGAMNAMAGLSITNSYTNTNSGGVQITQSLAGNTFINGTNGAMSYSGANANWTLTNFTANGAGNTVTYDRTVSNQLLQPTTDNTYHNLVINKADGQDMTTSSVITINNQLTLTAGDIIMGGQNLIIAATASILGGGSTSYIQDSGAGVLRKMTTSTGSFTAPIGGTAFSPITINLTSATIGGGASLDFSITDTAHPQRDRDNTGDPTPGDDNGVGKPAAVDFLDVFWTVAGNSITNPVYNATYIYDASDFTQTTESNMVGALYRAITGGTLDWLPTGTVNATNNTVTFNGAVAFGDFYAMDDTDERLPIVLLSFKAKPSLEAVELEWVTGAEVNNQFFTVERSSNGLDFEPILFVEGAGNSTELLTYTVLDNDPLLGRSYYKLKQTDFNGQFEYSEVVSVIFEGSSQFDFGLTSNPINHGETLAIWKTTSLEGLNPTLSLRDIRGQLITQASLPSLKHNDYQIPNSNRLSAGIYLLSVNYLGETKTKKIIVR